MAASPIQTIKVRVEEATGLTPAIPTAPCNAYVTVGLVDAAGQNVAGEINQTKVKSRTNNPNFGGQEFVFGETTPVASTMRIVARVWHKDSGAFSSAEPLGKVEVPVSILVAGRTMDDTLVLQPTGPLTEAKGTLHLIITAIGPPPRTEATSENTPLLGEEGSPGTGQPANELYVELISGHDLAAKNKAFLTRKKLGSSDPFVKLEVHQYSETSKVKNNELNPVWNERFTLPAEGGDAGLTVTVFDHESVGSHQLIGRARVALEAVKNGRLTEMLLKLESGQGVKDCGSVKLKLQWRYNSERGRRSSLLQIPKMGNQVLNMGSKVIQKFQKRASTNDDDDDYDDDDYQTADDVMIEEAEKKEAEERKKAQEELLRELKDYSIESGDYQIQVHIIECRDLKAKDVTGLSDPVVSVEVFGQTQYTQVHQQALSCVFDEVFIFNKRDLDKDDFQQATIKITVMDSDNRVRYESIGGYTFDTSFVYFHKDHEIYRTWVALMDDTGKDMGVTGYLKVSVTVLGPKDKLKVHDADEDEKKEKETEKQGRATILMPPAMKRWTDFLVVTLHKMEYLPVMDRGIGKLQEQGVDPYLKIQFGSLKPIKTKTMHLKGERDFLNPIYDQEIWIPINMPNASKNIKYTVYDEDLGGPHERIGQVFRDLEAIKRGNTSAQYINMYGPNRVSSFSNTTVDGNVTGQTWKDFYLDNPLVAPNYRGRLLISERIEKNAPSKMKLKDKQPFVRNAKGRHSTDNITKPSTTLYTLRAQLYIASGVSKIKANLSEGIKQIAGGLEGLKQVTSLPVRFEISCGKYVDRNSQPLKNENGICYILTDKSDGRITLDNIELPQDPSMIPDIIISLLSAEGSADVISFARIPAIDLLSKTFDSTPRWVSLMHDRHSAKLTADQSPGFLLVSIGMGPKRAWDQMETSWRLRQESYLALSIRPRTYELRLHLYMGRNLPALDSNGMIDPFLRVRFDRFKKETEVQKKTANPIWMTTFTFECTISDFNYAPLVVVELFDLDMLGTEKAGVITFSPNEFPVFLGADLKDGEAPPPPPKPRWCTIMAPVRGNLVETTGEILLSAQLLPKEKGAMIPVPPLVIETVPSWIEVTALGCRDLAPFQFRPMQSPFIECEVSTVNGKQIRMTNPSKKPDPNNPNFSQRLLIPVDLPRDEIFAPYLNLVVKDIRFGGMQKPVVGVANINLKDRMPWSSTYKPIESVHISTHQDASEEYKKNAELLEKERREAKIKAEEEKQACLGTREANAPELAVKAPMNTEVIVEDCKPEQDSGAGVLGALVHVTKHEAQRGNEDIKKANKPAADDDNLSVEEVESINDQKFMIGRESTPSELEETYKLGPFEIFPLFLGKTGVGKRQKLTGRFKGLVRVLTNPDAPPLIPLEKLTNPQHVVVRAYILRALALEAMDPPNLLTGQPGRSDPYLKLKLGKTKIDTRKDYIEDACEADLYQMHEFHTYLPGDSQLDIKVMDYDIFGGDDMIGRTVIDLEDRWFDECWQKMGKENENIDQRKGALRVATKPLERRALMNPSSSKPYGTLEMWTDILLPSEAALFPPDDIALPPTQKFEVRVVIWKAKDVVSMDSITKMNDLFVKVWLEGCELKQETDTHWRAKKGKGSFNYRLKFPVEVGPKTRSMKFPYLYLQMWDRDIVKWNDCIAEGVLDLGKYYRRAYSKKEVVTLFRTTKTIDSDNNDDEEEEEETAMATESQQPPTSTPAASTAPASAPPAVVKREEKNPLLAAEEGRGPGIQLEPLPGIQPSGPSSSLPQGPATATTAAPKPAQSNLTREASFRRRTKKNKKKPARSSSGCCTCGPKSKPDITEEDKEEDEEETSEFIKTIKEASGLYNMDPPDSTWIHMDRRNDRGGRDAMGSLCISIQIWPWEMAQAQPVGGGRNAPNHSPFLPPPVGRMKFSLNPFVLGSELLGPGLCAKLSCCIFCLGFILIMAFCQPFANIIIECIFRFVL